MKLIVSFFLLFFSFFVQASDVNVGVYYFPGWKSDEAWEKIRPFPEREPTLGWYKEGDDSVMRKQLAWMSDYGIDFVVFDWYWRGGSVKENHAIDAFRRILQSGVRFSILWANHENEMIGLKDMDRIAEYWFGNYFGDKRFLTVDGKPVVIVLSPRNFESSARKAGVASADLMDRVRALAVKRGFGGVYFIAASHAIDDVVNKLALSGYDGLTAYNYHFGLNGTYLENSPPRVSHSFDELSSGYIKTWNWFANQKYLPYWLPVTAGWDRRPWGGSVDPAHDNSEPTSEEFGKHLRAARDLFRRGGPGLSNYMVVCCWNEFGEGSYVEPTVGRGVSFLNEIKRFKSEK